MTALKELSRSERKRREILNAAAEVFLREGYVGASMDEIAALANVSKPTVYKNFASKEALFVEVVTSMTNATSDHVHNRPLPEVEDVAAYLEEYAFRQLTAVLTPQLMQLRRLVIGEVSRFPDLARVLWEYGPQRAMTALAEVFEHLAERGLLSFDDPAVAASRFNWLVMSGPLNRAMLLGDEAIPEPAELRRQAVDGVRIFLAAYGKA
ncbi:MAG: TetR/AcrR family transcriptional regulator [Rhizobiaceae bacterium]|nr:TetR/AcrR family transcriptional regulator [Rhizobiaceae bacterium]